MIQRIIQIPRTGRPRSIGLSASEATTLAAVSTGYLHIVPQSRPELVERGRLIGGGPLLQQGERDFSVAERVPLLSIGLKCLRENKQQVPPLRFAPVGMTILLCPQELQQEILDL
jgi:hypothetical protein